MNEEERKELIKKLHTLQDSYIEEGYQGFAGVIYATINLIEKQDKIINEMADYICEYDENHYTGERLWKSREQVIEYFTKKVGE